MSKHLTIYKDIIQFFGIVLASIVVYAILDSLISTECSTPRLLLAIGLSIGVTTFVYPLILRERIIKQQYGINLEMYKAVLTANQAINECSTEEQLFEKIVNLITTQSELDCAWVGKYDAASQTLIPVAHTGIDIQSLYSLLGNNLTDVNHGTGPCSRAFRENKIIVESHFDEPPYTMIRDTYGWQSCAAFPILCFQQPCIVLTVYSSQPNTFNPKNLQLLDELSTHIGFAIDAYATQRKQKQAAEQYESILKTTNDGFWVVDSQGRILEVNDRYCQMVGYSREELLSKHIWDISLLDRDQTVDTLDAKRFNSQGTLYETKHRTKYGEVLSIEISCTYQADTDVFISFLRDITARKKTETELNSYINRVQYLAFHDSLTNLPNRAVFQDRATQAVLTAKRLGTTMAIMVIDFDNFKHVNDSLGHAGGDFLLQSMAIRMQHNIRECDTLARLGGDEFGLIIDNLHLEHDVEIAQTIASKLIDSMQQPLMFEDHPMYMSISIGVAIYPQHADSFEELLKKADVAMYHAKKSGRNNFKIYTNDQYTLRHNQLEIQNGLHKALEQNKIVTYYQPKLNIHTNQICGAEALVRWKRGEEIVPPSVFIPVSEETNLISLICERVMLLACRECARWNTNGRTDLSVAINLSARQFQDNHVVDMIRRAIVTNNISPNMIEVEITESIAMIDNNTVQRLLGAISNTGVSIAMDDFGTGYSSLSGLRDLPINVVKIDQSFIRNLNVNEEATFMVQAILQLAKGLKLTTVAEGVETEEQLEFLRENGCDIAQGYLIGRPVPADEFFDRYIR